MLQVQHIGRKMRMTTQDLDPTGAPKANLEKLEANLAKVEELTSGY